MTTKPTREEAQKMAEDWLNGIYAIGFTRPTDTFAQALLDAYEEIAAFKRVENGREELRIRRTMERLHKSRRRI